MHFLYAIYRYQIPNQPIAFAEEKPTPKDRGEDALIAWTWHHFHDNPTDDQAVWLARLPMTKAGVRAMDAVEQFVEKRDSRCGLDLLYSQMLCAER